jgi:ribosomal protein S18 acetylase RimI-like enzyme
MIIEQATDSDAGIILELQKTAYQSEAKRYNDYDITPLTQTLDEIQVDFRKQIVLKAVIDGEIVGSVRAYMEKGTCFIGRLIVHPDYQNQGIGTRLMHSVENHFKSADRFELFTGNRSEEALNLYRKLGYARFKDQKMDSHTIVYFEKQMS